MNPQPSDAETWLYMLFLLPFFLYGWMTAGNKEEGEQQGQDYSVDITPVVLQPQIQPVTKTQQVMLTDKKVISDTISALRGLGFKGVGPVVKEEAQKVAYTDVGELIKKVLQNENN